MELQLEAARRNSGLWAGVRVRPESFELDEVEAVCTGESPVWTRLWIWWSVWSTRRSSFVTSGGTVAQYRLLRKLVEFGLSASDEAVTDRIRLRN